MTDTNDKASSSCSDALQLHQYEPLISSDAIRLLVLRPADSLSEPLKGSFIQISRHAELSKPTGRQTYSAVSYVWGIPDLSRRLLLEDAESGQETYLAITQTVEEMLQRLRRSHKQRVLWIDAICLNQKDDVEKSEQIAMMGEIYQQADKVHIWLGPKDGQDTARVMAFLRLLALAPKQAKAEDCFRDKVSATQQIQKFLRRPWFFRRWVLQEAVLAHYGLMHSGRHSIPLLTLCRGLSAAATTWHCT